MVELDFLSVADVLILHDDQLARYGGAAGIRDAHALESAVATPRATFDEVFLHEDIFVMAAAYAFHIAENQPFVDGNKRTGLAAALVFLELNGISIVDPEGELYGAMIDIANKRLGKGGLAALFRRLVAPPSVGS